MKMFIWENVSYLTSNYHNNGGVAVIADALDAARALLPHPDSDHPCEAVKQEPSAVYELAGNPEPRVFVFPDAGCC